MSFFDTSPHMQKQSCQVCKVKLICCSQDREEIAAIIGKNVKCQQPNETMTSVPSPYMLDFDFLRCLLSIRVIFRKVGSSSQNDRNVDLTFKVRRQPYSWPYVSAVYYCLLYSSVEIQRLKNFRVSSCHPSIRLYWFGLKREVPLFRSDNLHKSVVTKHIYKQKYQACRIQCCHHKAISLETIEYSYNLLNQRRIGIGKFFLNMVV